jgi:hypothetical protein
MAGDQPFDLSDTWHGRYAFPRLYEPVSFTAVIRHAGDWISGTVEESGLRRAAGRLLTATIAGRVTGDEVTFLKTYDVHERGYDAVNYVGRIGDGGLEISGTWSIPGNWSGTFIMIRSRGTPAAVASQVSERV